MYSIIILYAEAIAWDFTSNKYEVQMMTFTKVTNKLELVLGILARSIITNLKPTLQGF